jgi:hypothetical protein
MIWNSSAGVARFLPDHGLTYPIALDNDFATWQAFGKWRKKGDASIAPVYDCGAAI